MYLKRQAGEFTLRARADEAEGGFRASITVVRQAAEGRVEALVFEQQGVGRGFVFTHVKAALHHALDVGHREIRRREGRARSPFLETLV